MCPPPHPPGASAPIYPGVEPATLLAMAIPAASSVLSPTSTGASPPRPASSGSVAGEANTQTLALYAFIHTAAGCRRAGARSYVCSVMHDGRCLCRAAGAARWISSRCRGRLSCAVVTRPGASAGSARAAGTHRRRCRRSRSCSGRTSHLPSAASCGSAWLSSRSPTSSRASRGAPRNGSRCLTSTASSRRRCWKCVPLPRPASRVPVPARMLPGTPARKYTFFATS